MVSTTPFASETDQQNQGLTADMLPSNVNVKYLLFVFVFIVSFCLINIKKVETLGLGLFFISNILFCIIIGKDFLEGSISSEGKTSLWIMRYATLLIALAISFVSSILMIMTIYTLHQKFADNQSQSGIEWSPTNRQNLDNAEIVFITVTTFIGVTALYIYNTPEQVYKFVYSLFDSMLNGYAANWVRLLFPVAFIGIGSALYGRLEMPLLEVSKKPNSIACDPKNDPGIQQFKDSFIKTYWLLIAFVIIVLLRPLIEANFNIFGISPSMLLGFSPNDRSLIFGNNPSITLLSVLTLGMSNLLGINDKMRGDLKDKPANMDSTNKAMNLIISLLWVAALVAMIVFATQSSNLIYVFVLMGLLFGFIAFMRNNTNFNISRKYSIAINSIFSSVNY